MFTLLQTEKHYTMSKHFTHLHCHTEFSLLDGATSLQRLVSFGKEHDMKALAITDHGNMFGAVKFFQLCKKENIKPILGIEAYITEDAQVRSADNKYYHLILLAQNKIGYKNLCKLTHFSYQEGFYFKPRIDYQMLKKHSEGLIASTACLGGHIPKLLMNEKEQRPLIAQIESEESLKEFVGKHLFERSPFYLRSNFIIDTNQKTKENIVEEIVFKLF